MSRIETGPIQFGNDWPGLFIRGDECFAIRIALENLLHSTNPCPLMHGNLYYLMKLLNKCQVNKGIEPQDLVKINYEKC